MILIFSASKIFVIIIQIVFFSSFIDGTSLFILLSVERIQNKKITYASLVRLKHVHSSSTVDFFNTCGFLACH